MKKIIVAIFVFFCFLSSLSSQTIVNRGGAANTVSDSRFQAKLNAYIPRYADTASANTQIGIDSCGAIIYTYNIDGFWVRKCFPVKHWEQIQNGGSSSILPTCGLKNGTGLVSYDSLLDFDITAALYALCCDNITRTTNFTTVTLDTNSTDFQRYDLIILDTNGVNVIKGTPSLNPSTPATDNCQIILSYVLINAHDSVPAFISPTNPFFIYDENYNTEAVVDSINGVVMDTADLSNPVHLLHDIKVTSFSGSQAFRFTLPSTIDLNSYGAFKFYAKRTPPSVNALKLVFTWYLDGVQQTFPSTVTVLTGVSGYQVFIVPVSQFRVLGTSQVNQLLVQIQGLTTTFYIDWIQLQTGNIITNEATSGTVTAVSMVADTLYRWSIANPSTNVIITPILKNEPAYTIFRNESNVAAPNVNGTLDLSKPYFTNRLPLESIELGCDGCYFGTNSGVNLSIPFENDTTFVGNWLVRRTDPLSNNDTLYNGYKMRDTATLAFDTYFGMNSHSAIYTQGANNILKIAPDSLYIGTTLSGAVTGYVWTLKDPTTGSGYWAVGGGGGHPTLQEVFNTEVGGSVLTKTDTIQAGTSHILNIFFNLGHLNLEEANGGTALTIGGGGASLDFNSAEILSSSGNLTIGSDIFFLSSQIATPVKVDIGDVFGAESPDSTLKVVGSGHFTTNMLIDGFLKLQGSTGATTVTLGTNSPATLAATAPYTWFAMKAPDGTTVYVPAWK